MPLLFTRFSAAALAFVFTFSSLQFSAENLFQAYFSNVLYAQDLDDEVEVEEPAPTPTVSTDNGKRENDDGNTKFSTLKAKQAELTAQEMRGYQSLYEMQAELFAECVAKLKRWDGTLTEPEKGWPDGAETDLDKICAEEFIEMNEQGPQRLLLPDASGEQPATGQSNNWWSDVLGYWFGEEELLPPLKQSYTGRLTTPNAPTAKPANAELQRVLEGWYGRANSLGGEAFLWHYLTKKSLHAVPFQQGIVTISNCPNLSSPIFADQDCVKTEWDKRTNQLDNQRAKLIQKIGKKEDLDEAAKKLIAWYAVDDTELLKNYGLTASTSRNPLQLDIQKLSFFGGAAGAIGEVQRDGCLSVRAERLVWRDGDLWEFFDDQRGSRYRADHEPLGEREYDALANDFEAVEHHANYCVGDYDSGDCLCGVFDGALGV